MPSSFVGLLLEHGGEEVVDEDLPRFEEPNRFVLGGMYCPSFRSKPIHCTGEPLGAGIDLLYQAQGYVEIQRVIRRMA